MSLELHDTTIGGLSFQTAYDFFKIKVFEPERNVKRFSLEGENMRRALTDIVAVCEKARLKLNLREIKFTAPEMATSINSDFTHLTLGMLTATGKTPLYPLRLYFTTSNDSRRLKSYFTGEIFYCKTGGVGKYALNKWKVEKGFTVDRLTYNGRL